MSLWLTANIDRSLCSNCSLSGYAAGQLSDYRQGAETWPSYLPLPTPFVCKFLKSDYMHT